MQQSCQAAAFTTTQIARIPEAWRGRSLSAQWNLEHQNVALERVMRQCFAQRSLAATVGVNIRGIEEVQPGVHADPDDPVRFFLRCLRPRLEELVRRAKRACTEAKLRHLQT